MKKAITEGNSRYFLWIKKKIRILKDFTTIISYDDSGFKFKEYFVAENYPLKEDEQEVGWETISFKDWEIYSLSEKEAGDYMKQIMAKKIAKGN